MSKTETRLIKLEKNIRISRLFFGMILLWVLAIIYLLK